MCTAVDVAARECGYVRHALIYGRNTSPGNKRAKLAPSRMTNASVLERGSRLKEKTRARFVMSILNIRVHTGQSPMYLSLSQLVDITSRNRSKRRTCQTHMPNRLCVFDYNEQILDQSYCQHALLPCPNVEIPTGLN